MMSLMEPLFDAAYLGVVIALGMRLLLEEGRDAKRFGIMAMILGFGDAFHLVPRIVSNLTRDGFDRYVSLLSWGEFVTSITMTVFYVLFYHYYRALSGDGSRVKARLIYSLAALRVALVLLPQNGWGTTGSYAFGIIRNVPFAVMGLLLIVWCLRYRETDGLRHTGVLIAASFIFYIPVVVGVRFVPALGALMIPKTIAYVLLVVTGFSFFIKDFRPENLLKDSVVFLLLGLMSGVFYREFTKIFSWTGYTALKVCHAHLLALGFVLLILIYLMMQNEAESMPAIKTPLSVYFTGLALTAVTMTVRGIYTVTSGGTVLFPDAALSGAAGAGHIILGVGLVWLMVKIVRIKARETARV